MASYVFKLKAGKEFKDDKDLGVQGRLVYCNFLKTRSGYNKLSAPLFYHSTRGFTNELTNYYQFKEELAILKKSGSNFWLPNLPEVQFTQKGFLKTYGENDAFQDAFKEQVGEHFGKILEAKRGGLTAETSDRTSMEEEFEE